MLRKTILYMVIMVNIWLFTKLGAIQAVLDRRINNYTFDSEADTFDWTQHPCKRTCKYGEKRKTCYYVFVLETYRTMSRACYDCPYNMADCFRLHCIPADGLNKTVHVTNRQLPGVGIEVCEGDRIVVDVKNAYRDAATTIHWHGLRQTKTPYMDGVPYVTQCPILPGRKFRYTFEATTSGTYFWHAHFGGQRTSGLFGSLIIKTSSEENPHKALYDFDEHVMTVIDWKQQSEMEFFATSMHQEPTFVHTILINGLGRYHNFGTEGKPLYTPTTVFHITKGFRYRFRFINAGAESCPIQVSFDSHTMKIISADSNDVKPYEVDSFISWPGERYDFIIEANQPVDNYWIRYRGLSFFCNTPSFYTRKNPPKVFQVAILRYESAPVADPVGPVGYDIPENGKYEKVLNTFLMKKDSISTINLTSMSDSDVSLTRKPDHRFYLGFDTHKLDNYEWHRKGLYGYNQVSKDHRHLTPQINHITFSRPSVPALSQRDELDTAEFCNSTSLSDKDCRIEHCICTHVLQVKLNSVVEFIIFDEGLNGKFTQHTFHLHGHFFRVVAYGKPDYSRNYTTTTEIKELDLEGKIPRKSIGAPLKDTLRIPTGGYAVLRFYADNPGYWFYHCHYEEHVEQGLGLLFKVLANMKICFLFPKISLDVEITHQR